MFGIRPEAQEEHVVVDPQVKQLEIEQLNGHKLLAKTWPDTHDEQVFVELHTAQFTIEQL